MALPFHDETVLLLSYADDLALVVSGRGDKLRRTQHALDLISKKCEELGLKFSTEKSRAMMVKAASQPTLRGSSACKDNVGLAGLDQLLSVPRGAGGQAAVLHSPRRLYT